MSTVRKTPGKHWITALLLSCAVAPVALAADLPPPDFHARGPGAGGPGMMEGSEGMPGFLRGIDLSDEQRDRIFEITYAQLPRLREQHKLAEHARRDLDALGRADKYDEAKVAAAAEAEAKAMAALIVIRMRTDAQIRALLSADQRKQVDERRQRR